MVQGERRRQPQDLSCGVQPHPAIARPSPPCGEGLWRRTVLLRHGGRGL